MVTQPAGSLIVLSEVVKAFGDNRVLDGINLSVDPGECVVLIGSSGAGKSTLLRCINGLETFDAGRIRVAGTDVPPASIHASGGEIRKVRLKVGMVFQSFHLFPHLTVLENLTLAPVRVLGRSLEEAVTTARTLLKRVNLENKELSYPAALSGGEQQRVAIARALAMQPEVMLFDEPTSSLDPELVGEVLAVIADLAGGGMTTMIVTHQMGFARRCADRIVFLDRGRVAEEGPPEQILQSPHHQRLRDFLRESFF